MISRYINPSGHQYPEQADIDAGGQLTPIEQRYHNDVVICRFNLSNFTTIAFNDVDSVRPLSQSVDYYPLFAVGFLDTDSKLTTIATFARDPIKILAVEHLFHGHFMHRR
jgi:hypothetical protein